MPPKTTNSGADACQGNFTATHWSVIFTAANGGAPESAAALEQLCRTYWYPLYAFVRRQGHSPEDAEDLTQGFFAHLLRKEYVKLADPARGKFRSFLLAGLKHFVANEWARSTRLKRGGAEVPLSWDRERAEHRYGLGPTDHLTPEMIYEKQWAITLLEQVLARLKQEQIAAGREHLFNEVKGWLWGDKGGMACAELARRLGLTEAALKAAVHRLRLRYRELLREEISRTVATPLEVQEEWDALRSALRGGLPA